MVDELLSVQEAAKRLGGISTWTLHAWLSQGRLRRTKVEFIALGAKHLSRPAETLLKILQNSDLRGEWPGE